MAGPSGWLAAQPPLQSSISFAVIISSLLDRWGRAGRSRAMPSLALYSSAGRIQHRHRRGEALWGYEQRSKLTDVLQLL